MSFRAAFAQSFLVRVVLAVVFSWYGLFGSGGDPEAYHVLGRYLKDMMHQPANASLNDALNTTGFPELEETYAIHVENVRHFFEPRSVSQYLNTVTPILVLHALAYSVWDHPLSFLLLNCLLSAVATACFIRAFEIDSRSALWLILNPVALFFAATHYKESIAESLVLLFAASLYGRERYLRPLVWVGFMCLFRVSFAGLMLAFYAFKYTPLGKVRPLYLFLAVLVAFAILPPFYDAAHADAGSAGAVYSLVYRNEYTMKLLSPLLGLLLPMPFALSLTSENYYGGAFGTVYGLFYYVVGAGIVLRLGLVQRYPQVNALLNTVLFVSLVIGYLFLGASGVKDRYFAPFFPLMILVAITLRAASRESAEEQPARLGPEPAITPGIA